MCDERAKEKAKGCGETVKKRLTMQKQPSKRILLKRKFAKFTTGHLCLSLLFDKVRRCRSPILVNFKKF